MHMPPLETARLLVRPFGMGDLDAIYQLLDVDLAEADMGNEGALSRERRRQWLEWSVLNYEALASLYQPPYGDRAIISRQTGGLIGSCGYAPAMGPFDQLPSFGTGDEGTIPKLHTPEFGLYWAISPGSQRQGYAAEAGRLLIDYAFTVLSLKRVVATTSHDNVASIGVMRTIGMRIDRNPYPEPPWFQVVGILENNVR